LGLAIAKKYVAKGAKVSLIGPSDTLKAAQSELQVRLCDNCHHVEMVSLKIIIVNADTGKGRFVRVRLRV
jgi:hypothetical protein